MCGYFTFVLSVTRALLAGWDCEQPEVYCVPPLFIIVVAILSTKINICMVTNNKISDHGDLAQYKWMEMNSSAADEDEELQFYTNRKNSSNLSLHIFSCIIICCQIHEDSLFMLIFMMNEFLGLRL